MDDEQEKETNEFAGNWLISPRKFREFFKRRQFRKTDILTLSLIHI